MERPVSVTVFGILNIVFGVLGLCGMLVTVVILFSPEMAKDNPALAAMQTIPAYHAFMVVSLGLGTIASLVLIVAGIGLLMSQGWARVLSIIYGWYAVVFGIIGMVFNLVYVIPVMTKNMGNQGNPQAVGAAVGGMIGGVCGGVIGMIFPVVLLVFMYRRNVVAFFRNQQSELIPESWDPPHPPPA